MSATMKIFNHIPVATIFSFCNSLENSGRLESNFIVNSLRSIWPTSKSISKHDVSNIYAKVMKLLPIFKEASGDYEHFKFVVNATLWG